jgi:hypothetical protein
MRVKQAALFSVLGILLSGCYYQKQTVVSAAQQKSGIGEYVPVLPLRIVQQNKVANERRLARCPFIRNLKQLPGKELFDVYSLKIRKEVLDYAERYVVICGLGEIHDKLCGGGSQLEISIPPEYLLPESCFWDGVNGECIFHTSRYNRSTFLGIHVFLDCINPPILHY